MTMQRPIRWSSLLMLFAWSQQVHLSCAVQAREPGPARRLELAAGSRDDVVPVAIGTDHSRWQPVGGHDPAAVRDVPTTDIVRWGRCPPWPLGPIVLLGDGGVIAGRIESADERTVVIATATFGRLTLPIGVVRGSRAGLSIGPGVLGGPAASAEPLHTLLLANGDRVSTPRIIWRDEALSVDFTPRHASSTAPASVSIPAAAVRAVDFAPATAVRPAAARPATASPRILVSIMDGSRFMVRSLEPAQPLAGTARLSLTLAASPVSVACDAEEIVAVAVDGGRATFLAARTPAAYDTPDGGGPRWPLSHAQGVTGDWPEVRGMTSFTALGIHAPARVRYRLDEPATRFESLVAIDDTAGDGGSVIVRVLAGTDGAASRELFSSAMLRGGEEPQRIRVDLPSITELELVVEPADGGAILDRTLWLDPLVVRHGGGLDDEPRTSRVEADLP